MASFFLDLNLGKQAKIVIEHTNGRNREDVIPTQSLQKWTVRRVALAGLITLSITFGFFLLYQFYMIVFLFFVAMTLAVAIRPIVEWLQVRGLREGVGVLVVFGLLLAILVGLAWLVGPLVIEQISTLVAQLPEYYRTLRRTLAESDNALLHQVMLALPVVPELSTPTLAEEATPFNVLTRAWQFIQTFGYVIFAFGAVVLLAFYLTLEGELITRRMMLLVPITRREEVRTILAEMGGTIGGYFRGQAILCVLIGILSLIGYWSIGLPNALGLALVMALFEAIPMIGPMLGAIPAVLVAFSTAPELVLWVLGVVIVIQVMENNLLVPRVMNQSVGINPIVSMLSIAAFGAMFGLVGAILAIPLAAMLQIVLNRLFFRLSSVDESVAAAQTASSTARNVASKIRLQAQEIVLDVRKGLRSDDGTIEPEIENIQESLEAIASELDSILGRAEQTV